MSDIERHTILKGANIKQALEVLNNLAADAILFVIETNFRLLGSLTDGDVRRGFLKGLDFNNKVEDFVQPNPKYLDKGNFSLEKLIEYRTNNLKIIPLLDEHGRIEKIINFRKYKSYLPIEAVIMAGGKGERLKPLTNDIPKPLLKVGDKPIIEHNIDLLAQYGINKISISIKYLGEKIIEYFGDGSKKNIIIDYINENKPLGTLGAVSIVPNFIHDTILVMNSDLLTNINLEDFYKTFHESNADLAVASIPYHVNVPYAVLEVNKEEITSFKEKPKYTYYSNGGIYLFKRSLVEIIPKNTFYNATDFMEALIQKKKKVIHYPLLGYWLDIGKPDDYLKAQADIIHLNL